ncbi:MAG: TonB-dependent receptor plug domain-containing protein [Bacteroidales bacterium]|nr:TonB-dependent receptor plug domain-containing protein [Bacteroidales bacterium]
MKIRVLLLVGALICVTLSVSGQITYNRGKKKVTISGIISGPDKNPVTGAQIFIDGIKTRYISDDAGKYKIKISRAARKILVYSPESGYNETDINGQTTINLTLNGVNGEKPAFIKNIEMKESSGRTKKVAKPQKMNTYTDIYQMIRSEVPGVVVSGRSIMVQGPNSFFGSSQPLFVVNGAKVNNIDFINPAEVKSIQLLKGSSATIYGLEGANGVISITLFKGSEK